MDRAENCCSNCWPCGQRRQAAGAPILGDDGAPTRNCLTKCLDNRLTMCIEAGVTTASIMYCSMTAATYSPLWISALTAGGVCVALLATGFAINCLCPANPDTVSLTRYEITGTSTYELMDDSRSSLLSNIESAGRGVLERVLSGSDDEFVVG